MKKYIRTKDGRIVDIGAFIENEKTNRYYKDYIFDEIENRDGKCYLHWTAIGSEENDSEGQRGVRGDHAVYIDSPFIEQADTIEELVDVYVAVHKDDKSINLPEVIPPLMMEIYSHSYTKDETIKEIFGAIWTDKGLIYVAKMNEEGKLELL